jgi:glycosyltransferase involved in cell wall biosynthesis
MSEPSTSPKSKKKAIIFVPEFPRLSETFIEREISKLIEWGNLDITVFTLKAGTGYSTDAVRNRVVCKRLGFGDVFSAAIFSLGKLPQVFQAFSLIKGNQSRSFSNNLHLFLKSLGYAYLFSKYSPDIIYANFMSEPSTVCLLAAEVLGCEFAISAHAKDILVTTSENISENAELVAAKVHKAKFVSICNRHAYESVLAQSNVADAGKVRLIYHGLDFEQLKEIESPMVEKPSLPVIFTNGRFTEKKGHKYLIDASKILKERGFRHLVYLFGGPGDFYDRTVAYIKELGVEDTVKVIGEGKGMPFNEVLAYYKIADVVAFSSIDVENGDSDGIANMLIEASAFEVPIVATDAGSTLELIQHDRTGLVVLQRDALALANGLERVLSDSTLGSTLARNAHTKAKDMFDLDVNVGEIEKLLLA